MGVSIPPNVNADIKDYLGSQPRLVWSGSASSVAMTATSEPGPGLYLVKTDFYTYGVQVSMGNCYGGVRGEGVSSSDLRVNFVRYDGSNFVVNFNSVGTISAGNRTIKEVYKL